MKLPKLLIGTLVALLVLLVTDYLYYGLINDTPTSGSAWGPKILYGLFYSLSFAYIYIKSAAILGTKLLRGLMVGVVIGLLVLSAQMFTANANVVSPGLGGLWVIIQNILIAAVLTYTLPKDPCVEGIGGQEGDDGPRNPTP